MKFNGTIIITDPCYLVKETKWDERKEGELDDWDRCEYGSHMERLGIMHCWVKRTGVGDGCWRMNDAEGKPLGGFAADSGQVGCFLMDEVLKYNPELKDKDWTDLGVVFNDFNGDVSGTEDESKCLVIVVNGSARCPISSTVFLDSWDESEDE